MHMVFKFEFLLMAGCLLLAPKMQHFGIETLIFADILFDFFPVYSSPNLMTANHLNLCSYLPHYNKVSILTNSTG